MGRDAVRTNQEPRVTSAPLKIFETFTSTYAATSQSRCSVTMSGQDSLQQTFVISTLTRRECISGTRATAPGGIPSSVPAVAERLIRGVRGAPDNLSRREREVLRWMAEGKSTWEISRILHISERTVYFHVQNIMEKLGASCRSHAVSIAVRAGLCEQG